MKLKLKTNKYQIRRFISSLILPTLIGIGFYGFLTGFYTERHFWLGAIFVIPQVLLYLIVPSLIYFGIMEYLGRKLFRNSVTAKKRLLNSVIYLAAGTATGGILTLLMEIRSIDGFYKIGLLTGLHVALVKMRLHNKERKYPKINNR